MQDRIQRQLRESGVTIVNGVNTYIEVGVRSGRTRDPSVHVHRPRPTIGADCAIGPFAGSLRDSVVPEGHRRAGASTAGHQLQDLNEETRRHYVSSRLQ